MGHSHSAELIRRTASWWLSVVGLNDWRSIGSIVSTYRRQHIKKFRCTSTPPDLALGVIIKTIELGGGVQVRNSISISLDPPHGVRINFY